MFWGRSSTSSSQRSARDEQVGITVLRLLLVLTVPVHRLMCVRTGVILKKH